MSSFNLIPTTIKILILADVDIFSVSQLTEKLIKTKHEIDCIILLGPFHDVSSKQVPESNIQEKVSQDLANIAQIIAQLENIVCRVIYLSSEQDPVKSMTEQLHLTPNSVNIYGRSMSLLDGLFISGFTEKTENINSVEIDKLDDEMTPDEVMETLPQNSQLSTSSIIQEILLNSFSCDDNYDEEALQLFNIVKHSYDDATSTKLQRNYGIFVFNFKYAHSLSNFLFHMNDIIESSNIKLCVFPAISSTSSIDIVIRLPSVFGKLHIAKPKSLKDDNEYLIVNLSRSVDNYDWITNSIDVCTLNKE